MDAHPSAVTDAATDKLTLLQVSHRYDVDVATLHALVGRGALPAPTWSQGRLGWREDEVRTPLRRLAQRP